MYFKLAAPALFPSLVEGGVAGGTAGFRGVDWVEEEGLEEAFFVENIKDACNVSLGELKPTFVALVRWIRDSTSVFTTALENPFKLTSCHGLHCSPVKIQVLFYVVGRHVIDWRRVVVAWRRVVVV